MAAFGACAVLMMISSWRITSSDIRSQLAGPFASHLISISTTNNNSFISFLIFRADFLLSSIQEPYHSIGIYQQHFRLSQLQVFIHRPFQYLLSSLLLVLLLTTYTLFLSPYYKSSKWVVEVTTKRLLLLLQRSTQQSKHCHKIRINQQTIKNQHYSYSTYFEQHPYYVY